MGSAMPYPASYIAKISWSASTRFSGRIPATVKASDPSTRRGSSNQIRSRRSSTCQPSASNRPPCAWPAVPSRKGSPNS